MTRFTPCPACGAPAKTSTVDPDGLELVECSCLADRGGPNRTFLRQTAWERAGRGGGKGRQAANGGPR